MGQRVHVLLDRIDRQQRRLQFALVPSGEESETKSLRKGRAAKVATSEHTSPNRSGRPRKSKEGKTKSKTRARDKKSKGKRK